MLRLTNIIIINNDNAMKPLVTFKCYMGIVTEFLLLDFQLNQIYAYDCIIEIARRISFVFFFFQIAGT